jgi:hypothetical protein
VRGLLEDPTATTAAARGAEPHDPDGFFHAEVI